MKTLYIIASPRGEMSKSIELGNFAIEKIGGEINIIDVNKDQIPYISSNIIAMNYGFCKYTELSSKDKIIADLQSKYIEQIKSADNIVIAVPMWNFSMPAALKAWFDLIIKINDTFEISNGNYNGLVKNIKKAIVVGARGGKYIGTPNEGYDYLSTYINGLLGFIGINSESFWLEGVNILSQNELNNQINTVKKSINSYI